MLHLLAETVKHYGAGLAEFSTGERPAVRPYPHHPDESATGSSSFE